MKKNIALFILSIVFTGLIGGYSVSAEEFDTYRYSKKEPLAGKMAKFIVVGQIKAAVLGTGPACDISKFEMMEVNRLVDIANRNPTLFDPGKSKTYYLPDVVAHGVKLAMEASNSSDYCDRLSLDAANWSMWQTHSITKKELEDIKMLAALGNNDCNDETYPDKYSNISNVDTKATYVARLEIELKTNVEDSRMIQAAEDVGYSYGITNLDKNCPIIEKFAKNFVQ